MLAHILALALVAAQSGGVTVSGVVQDQTAAVLPSAQVALKAVGAVEPLQAGTTDGAGRFHFDRVHPGDYEVRAEFPGFKAVVTHVRVGTRAPASLTIVLPLEGLTQGIGVSAAGGGVEASARSNLNAISVDASTLDDLPTLDQDLVGSMSRFLDSTAIGTNGVTVLVDGIEVNALALSASAVQQIKINQDPYSAEFMRPGRGRIEVVSRPGGKEYSGTFNVRFRESALYARNAFATTKPSEHRWIFEGTVGGPLKSAKSAKATNFLLSASIDSEASDSIVFADTPGGLVHANAATPSRQLLIAGTLSHQQGDRNTQSMRFSHFDRQNTNQGVGGTALPESGFNHDDREDEATFSNQTVVSPRLLNDVKVLFGVEREPRTSISAAPRLVVLDAFTGGGAQIDSLRTEHHFTLLEGVTWSPPRHVVRFGINVPDWSWRGYDDRTNTGGTFYFSSLADFEAGTPYSFVQQVGNGQVNYLEKVVGLFVQDEMRPRPNVSIAAGIRYDWQSYVRDENNLAPRVSLAYAPTESGELVIRGGAGVFYDRLGPTPVIDAIRFDGIRLRRYVISNPAYPRTLDPAQSPAAQPPSIVTFAAGATIPSTVQYSVGVERALRPKTTLAITLVGTRGYQLFRSRDVNAPVPPLYMTRPDPAFGVVREIESAGTRKAVALESTIRTQSRHFSATAQYTEARNSDDTGGITWVPPNSYDLSHEYAPSDGERRHALNAYGSATAGKWVNLGVSVEAASGRPYSVITGRDDFNTGTANARPAGVPRNSLRGPGYASLDVRWWRDLAFTSAGGRKTTMTVGVDAFNVLNRVNAAYYVGTLSSPFFGQAIAALPPRRVQFSLRARF